VRSGTANPGPAAPAAPLAARLSAVPGVQGVLVVRAVPGLTIPGRFENLGVNAFGVNQDGTVTPIPAGVVSCAQLATVPALGRCPAGAATAEFPADGFNGPLGFNANADTYTWPAANVPAAGLDALGVDGLNVATNGATATVERARTLLEASVYPTVSPPSTYADTAAQDNSQNSGYQQLANVVILVSLAIAGCTLAAGIAAGLAERKRPFSLLRLTGARLSTLRGVVALEGAVPLLTVAVVAIGTGFGAAAMYATEAQNRPMVAPGLAYYLLTVGGIIVSLAIIAATFPILTRITGPEAARND
ncbi:MAG: ABC transporter permease, partial [Gemmatimonadales bacterium]